MPSLDSVHPLQRHRAISPLGVVVVALLVNGLGEETGWRGFAVDRLLRDHSFTWTALVVAVAGAVGTCRSSGWSLASAAWGRSRSGGR